MRRKTEDLYTYYNWQFLRRNSEYRSEYDRYASLLKTKEHEALQMIPSLINRWGMSGYVDWRLEEPDFLNLFFEPVVNFGLRNYDELIAAQNPIDDFVTLRPGDRKKPRFLLMALDLERLRSKDYENFWKVAKEIQAEYELKTKEDVERITSNPAHLDVILATYDEHEKNPTAKSYEIADTLIALYAEPNANPSQHSRKVEENLVRAKKLIQAAPNILFDFSAVKESK